MTYRLPFYCYNSLPNTTKHVAPRVPAASTSRPMLDAEAGAPASMLEAGAPPGGMPMSTAVAAYTGPPYTHLRRSLGLVPTDAIRQIELAESALRFGNAASDR